MPLIPNILEQFTFFTLQAAPSPLLDMWSGPAFASVLAAIRLDVFNALAKGPQTAAQVAATCKADARGMQLLLETLISVGYITGRNGTYDNSRVTKKWMLRTSEIDLSSYYLYWGALMEHFMLNTEESVRTGKPPVHLYEWIESQPEVSRWFQEGMIALAKLVAKDVARAMTIPQGATRLLDVGGGHGVYTIALAQRYPSLTAVIADNPQPLVTGKASVEKAGLANRISLHAADFMRDPLPTDFDVALLFNIVHGFNGPENVNVFKTIGKSLKPGGTIAVLEQIHGVNPLPLGRAATNILSLAFYHLLGGQVYTFEEIKDWLQQAGYIDVQRRNVLTASSAIITARKA